jgi:hypothetical protein
MLNNFVVIWALQTFTVLFLAHHHPLQVQTMQIEERHQKRIQVVTTGEALARASGHAALKAQGALIEETMMPAHQLGFSKDGCLIAFSIARHLLKENPTWVCFVGDEEAAFQRGSRDAMRRILMRTFPDLVQWFEGMYGHQATVVYKDRVIDGTLTMEGVWNQILLFFDNISSSMVWGFYWQVDIGSVSGLSYWLFEGAKHLCIM